MNKKGASIKWLLNKLIFSFALSILGSWGLLVFHLEEISAIAALKEFANYAFLIDMALRTMTFLGFFMSAYYYAMLRPRLKRVAELVGDRW